MGPASADSAFSGMEKCSMRPLPCHGREKGKGERMIVMPVGI